jgi:lysophospholipase L1-like esterase
MKQAVIAVALLAVSLAAAAQQPSALLDNSQAAETFDRAVQLMESTAIVMPELNRPAEPLVENARQAAKFLHERGGHLPTTYSFLTNLRAYVLLADSVPKPFPFPQEAAKQLAELRELLARIDSHFSALLADREAALRNPDRDDLKRYADANGKLPPLQSGKPRAVFLGDSITDFWRLNQYFPEQDFVNRGISGQVTGEMLGRFKSDVIDLNPMAVVILAGTNDLARNVPVPVIENNYAMMADLADRHAIRLIFASVLPVSDFQKARRPPESIRALNAWLKSFCQQRGCAYLDYYSAMIDQRGMLKAELADDGLHPNGTGYRVMAPLALDAIRKVTESAQQKSGRGRHNKKES